MQEVQGSSPCSSTKIDICVICSILCSMVKGPNKTSEINGAESLIVGRARELASEGGSLSKVSSTISDEMRITASAISLCLLEFNRGHLDDFIPFTQQLRAKVIGELYERYKAGQPLEEICKLYPHVKKDKIIQVCRSACLSEFLGKPTKYMYNEDLDDESLEPAIVAKEPLSSGKASKRPAGLPPYLAELYDRPLLTFEQEQYLFRRMNYHKNKAAKTAQACLALDDAGDGSIKRILETSIYKDVWESEQFRNRILDANLRLVVSVVKNWRGSQPRFWEMVSDGNVSLMKIVDGFDYKRGYKFSTYGVNALKRNFSRSEADERKLLAKEQSGYEELPIVDEGEDTASDDADAEQLEELQSFVHDMLEQLDPRDAEILRRRNGIGGKDAGTLKVVGEEVGVTKERVRQLEGRAKKTLRRNLNGLELEDLYEE
jgi:RNA polymerase primary sigma factor